MLVLTRRMGEEILIADNIRAMVVAVNRNQVRLGITAPSFVPVARQELVEDCAEESAASTPGRKLPR